MSGRKRDPRLPQRKKPLSHGWIVAPSKTYPDRVYFYNTITGCSTWDNPCEVAESRDSITASSSKIKSVKTRVITPETLPEKSQKFKSTPHSPSKNYCGKINSDIEDYNEQDSQYFNNIPISTFSLSHSNFLSPLSSPDSVSSLKSDDADDSDVSEHNALLETSDKQLWVHFVGNPTKKTVKKSIALSDISEPSTIIQKLGMETTEGSKKKVQFPQTITRGHISRHAEANETDKIDVALQRKRSRKKKKGNGDKIIKSVAFRKRDKTPAQTRLLKLRKQNAEKLKELAIKHPNLFSPNTNEIGKANSDVSDTDRQSGSDNFSNAYFRQPETSNSPAQELTPSKDEFSEEMDWEPSTEESDVRNINVFRQQLSKANDSSSDIFFGLQFDSTLPLPSKTHSWFVVLDTNIFVSCLSFVKNLRDMAVPDLGYPVIYVPWRVLQELDHLKDTKIDGVNRRLHSNVRKAIAFLNENFKLRHPRIFGQSFEDFTKMVDVNTSAPDDEILQTCIEFQKQHPNVKLMLLTNDKNLESKALVSGVEVYSKESFRKKYLNSGFDSSTFNSTSIKPTAFNSAPSGNATDVDNFICEIKTILKDFIPLVVETEMRIAFDGDWVKLAFKKPPWNLQDALECLLKHWRSVFFLVFSKETQSETQRLYERLFKMEAGSVKDVIDIIVTIQRLILSIKRSQKKKRPYLDLIEVTITKLSNLLSLLSSNHSPEVDSGISPSLLSPVSTRDSSYYPPQQVTENDVSRVKNLFKDIWDSLRSFCCSISDIVHSSSACDSPAIQEVRLKMSQTINEVIELVLIVEQIFEINPIEVIESHPLIAHFSNFLIRVYPAMQLELQRELPRCLAAFFTDFEGRSLLGNSLKDFKEFSNDLMNAAEYFNTRSMC